MELILTYTQLFTSQGKTVKERMDWSCLHYLRIIVMRLSSVWTLFLMAPIHCWASDVLLNLSKSIQIKKQTHLYIGWPEGEYIFSKFSFFGELFLWGISILWMGSNGKCVSHWVLSFIQLRELLVFDQRSPHQLPWPKEGVKSPNAMWKIFCLVQAEAFFFYFAVEWL